MSSIKVFPFNPIETNTYIVHDSQNKEGLIIDPSCADASEFSIIDRYIKENGISIKHILLTHPHFDHLMGASMVCNAYNLPLELHEKAVELLSNSLNPIYTYGFKIDSVPENTVLLHHKDEIIFGSHKMEVRYTPGHCEGSVVYVWAQEKTVFVGDVLFRDSIGRTDLKGGDLDILKDSISKQLFTLEGDYTVRPGHGGRTTIEYEKLNNPFLYS